MSAMSACVGFNPGAPAPGNRSNADGVPVKTLLSLSTVSITPVELGSSGG
jgi:hypothetical protein